MPVVERYIHGHHPSVLRNHSRRTIADSAQYLQEHLNPGVSVLDVGAGPGSITIDFARTVAPGQVVGVDASEEIMLQASQAAESESLSNAKFHAANVYELDFEDDTFDIVHAHQMLQYLRDPVAALREMARVAKPGGVVAARDVVYGGAMWYPLLGGLDEWMATYQKVARANGGEPNAGRSLKSWALKAGLEVVSSTASVWCFTTEYDRKWWGESWAERALDSEFAVQSLDAGVTTREGLERISEAWMRWSQADDGWLALPHGEIIARAGVGAP